MIIIIMMIIIGKIRTLIMIMSDSANTDNSDDNNENSNSDKNDNDRDDSNNTDDSNKNEQDDTPITRYHTATRTHTHIFCI